MIYNVSVKPPHGGQLGTQLDLAHSDSCCITDCIDQFNPECFVLEGRVNELKKMDSKKTNGKTEDQTLRF